MTASTAARNAAPLAPTRLAEELQLASEVNVPVLITAASADDREAYARVIHGAGHSTRGPFISLGGRNLESLPTPASLRSGECDAGDAESTRRLERSGHGTLYVDDITELDGNAQAQLLAWLEERGRLRPSSGNCSNQAVRLIAGASRHLDRERASGVFSEPLFYRLNMIHIDLTAPAEGVAMKAREIMTTPPYICRPDSNLAEVARLMWNYDCGFIAVVDLAGAVKGVLTDRDICIAAATRAKLPEQLSAGEAMSSAVHSVLPDDSIDAVLAAMKQFKVRRVPVIDANGQLHGVVSMNDIVLAAGERGGPAPREVIATMAAICAHRRTAATLR